MTQHRLYFLLPDEDTAFQVTEDLRAYGIPDHKLHAVAKRDTTFEHEIPEAKFAEQRDLWNAAKRGAATGGSMGLLGGLLAVAFPPAGIAIGGGALLASTAVGAGLGTWAATLIGVSEPNEEIEEFNTALQEGKILMLVDVENENRAEIESRIKRRFTDAVIRSGRIEHHKTPLE